MEHADQSRLLLSVTPAVGGLIDRCKSVMHNVRKGLNFMMAIAPQLALMLGHYIVEKIVATRQKNNVQPTLTLSALSLPHLSITGNRGIDSL